MKNHHNFASDDQDDRRLFSRMQEHVLKNFPNPQRVGCLDHDTLRKIVLTPEEVDLTDPKYMHVFECAECTRELIELRNLRKTEREKTGVDAEGTPRVDASRCTVRGRTFLVASACGLVTVIAAFWHHISSLKATSTSVRSPLSHAITVNLEEANKASSSEHVCAIPAISLPRRRIVLHLILPASKPAGNYRITVTCPAVSDQVEVSANALAVIRESRTELQTSLNLRHVSKDALLFHLFCLADESSISYRLSVE